MKPLTKRELLRLCVLLRRYAAEVRIRRGLSEANLVKTVVGYVEEYIHTTDCARGSHKEKR